MPFLNCVSFLIECKLCEDRDFCPFQSLMYPQHHEKGSQYNKCYLLHKFIILIKSSISFTDKENYTKEISCARASN